MQNPLIFSLFFFFFIFFLPSCSSQSNLAQGKPAYASSQESTSFPASNAFDGNLATRWSSSYTDSHSLWVDLGKSTLVNRVVIYWEAAYATQYQIQTSLDGTTWTTVFSDYSATSGTKTITFTSILARYVKIYCIKRATVYGFSIWEFQIFNDGGSTSTKQKILNYLYSISGQKTIAGQHDKSPDIDPLMYNKQVVSITGKYPALWSSDFLFYSLDKRWTMTYEAEAQFNKGALINIMWHACPPSQPETCEWDGGVMSHLSDAQWNDLITDGGSLNTIWKQRMDNVAVYLKYLQDKGVVVLFRPHHEMNQGVFWWGGRTGSKGTSRLYQITHDYMTKNKGLSNLIWVWDVQDIDDPNNGNAYNPSLYNPGDAYWDVAALDVYSDGFTNLKYYNGLVSIIGSKLFVIGECGKLPTPSQLNSLPKAAFFMEWSETLKDDNTNQAIQDIYYSARVLTLGDMPGWR